MKESEKLRLLCDLHKVRLVDESVLFHLTPTIAWEIVDFNLKQHYRCDLIYRTSNYTLEDFETHQPMELFHRPQLILEYIIQAIQKLHLAKKRST